MIEQTPLVVSEWTFYSPANFIEPDTKINSYITLDVMKKRASIKKGIACRFSSSFVSGDETILTYVAEDSYVIDLADVIDKNELMIMLRNSYSKFNDTFEIRKFGTILQHKLLPRLNESGIDINSILSLLM